KKVSVGHKIEMEEKRHMLQERRITMGYSVVIDRDAWRETLQTFRYSRLLSRHITDEVYIDPNYEETLEDYFIYLPTNHDEIKDHMREPTFSRFKIPLEIWCYEGYNICRRDMNRQLKREIKLQILNMPTAAHAWQYVRTMTFTTLWPPLHTRNELKQFQTFCRLSPTEQKRYDKIMATNII
ncbi:hypothetical protein KR018_005583, partial [Drosophila ironensis]